MVCRKGCDGLMIAYLTNNKAMISKSEEIFTIGCLMFGMATGCD